MRVALVLVFVAACGSSPAVTVVEVPPVDLPTPTPTPTPTLAQPAPHRAQRACTAPADLGGCDEVARVRVGTIALSSSTCFVDLRVRTGDIGRLMRCPTSAVVAFDRIQYGGTYDGRNVDACVLTRFPFNDGCTWQSMQRVRGTRDSLVITYKEEPVSGSGCASSSCTARAQLEVLP